MDYENNQNIRHFEEKNGITKELLSTVSTEQTEETSFLHIPGGADALSMLKCRIERSSKLRPGRMEELQAFLNTAGTHSPIDTICLNTEDGRWFQLQQIPSDCSTTIITKDITQARSIQLLGQACMDKWDIITSERSLCFCVTDLTDNDILYSWPQEIQTGKNYEQAIERLAARYVDPQDRERFEDAVSRKTLLSVGLELSGQEKTVRFAPECGFSGNMNVRTDIIKDPYSGNICACLLLTVQESAQSLGGQLLERDNDTGAYTRAAFVEQFADRKDGGVLVAVRVNRMDRINDVLGTRRGDQILREVAWTLSALLRDGEILGRCRGAEFIAYLNHGTEALLKERLSIICTVLTRELEQNIKMSVHVGVMPVEPGENSFYDLYENAQLALRSIPDEGESVYAFYKPEMRARVNQMLLTLPKSSGEECRVFIRTFGYFDVFVDGSPMRFQGGQAKELMALLVDRRGGYLSSAEAVAYLWENEPANRLTLTRLRKVAMHLKRSLEAVGIEDIVEFRGSVRRIVPERVQCDYYDFLLREGERKFPGNYMTNYSWAESTLADLLE